jgi:threonylcarbamoyladenosine tRNA methylthiotransferase MtaB
MSESERPATAAILTLGCKLNIADSEAMALRLRRAGWNVVDRLTDADAVIVNSCSVTRAADQKSRHLLRLARRVTPGAVVALTGCLVATASADTLEGLVADRVLPRSLQDLLADEVAGLRVARAETLAEKAPAGVRPGLKTRAFISAQEGCNDVCAFCIIPRTRGRERSKPVAAVVEEARAREAEGAREIVITGTQLGAYGRDRGDATPYDLLAALLKDTAVPRIRMSSLQPQDITPALVDLWQDPRLCRHFHLALQSGSGAVLQRMRRRYDKHEYAAAVERLRRAVPEVAITTDVIAGFPGESEAEFQESYEFCRDLAFAGMHVFPYSQRDGTLAARMPNQVPEPLKKQRVRVLLRLAEQMAETYRGGFIGGEADVLWEERRPDGRWEGLTDTYVRVRAPGGPALHNRITATRVLGLEEDGLAGEVSLA